VTVSVRKLAKNHIEDQEYFIRSLTEVTAALSNKKLIRRWDSERELFTTTSYTHYSTQ